MLISRRAWPLVGLSPAAAMAKRTWRPLKIGVEDRWPPFAFEEQGQARGQCVEIVRKALGAAGIPHTLEPMPFRRCVHLTQHGTLDACLTVVKKPSLQATLAFSSVPLLHVTGLVFARKGTVHDRLLRDTHDMAGRRLAVALGFDYGEAIDGDARITKLPTVNPENVFKLLLLDRADYAIYESSRAMDLFRRRPELRSQLTIVGSLAPQAVYMAFAPRLAGLGTYRKAFDQALAALPDPLAMPAAAPSAQSAPISLSKRSALST